MTCAPLAVNAVTAAGVLSGQKNLPEFVGEFFRVSGRQPLIGGDVSRAIRGRAAVLLVMLDASQDDQASVRPQPSALAEMLA